MTLSTINIKLFAVFAFMLVGTTIARGQSAPAAAVENPFEVAGTFAYVHTNAPPGGCGCISLYGVGGSFAYYYGPHFALVADTSFVHNGNVDNTSQGLSYTSYLFGARVPVPLRHVRVIPFGQVLLGAIHVSGPFSHVSATNFQNDSDFSAAVGGGLDYRITPHLTLRAVQAEYLLTHIPNGVNDRQNNLRIQSGVAVRF